MQGRILVIDDEEAICEILKYNLEKEGYDVETAYSAEEALGLNIAGFSLLIVDIMMDKMSGFELVKKLKYNPQTENIPVIFCTALSGEDDTVMGLNIGGDDYITKPFVIGAVIARVKAVLRRAMPPRVFEAPLPQKPQQAYEPDITFKALRINLNEKQCYINGNPVKLTRNELDLLLFLMGQRNRILSRQEIMENVWPDKTVIGQRAIDVNIKRLRDKLQDYGKYIHTKTGYGYGFKEEV